MQRWPLPPFAKWLVRRAFVTKSDQFQSVGARCSYDRWHSWGHRIESLGI